MASIGGEFPADFMCINECVQQYKGQRKKLKVNTFCDYFSSIELLQEPIGDTFPCAFLSLNLFYHCFDLSHFQTSYHSNSVSVHLAHLGCFATCGF